jgi:hypothetical protein
MRVAFAALLLAGALAVACAKLLRTEDVAYSPPDAAPSDDGASAAEGGSDAGLCPIVDAGVGPVTPVATAKCGDAMVDLRDNPNCGECFHPCAENVACNQGVCGPDVVAVSDGGYYARPLALRDGELLWSWQTSTTRGILEVTTTAGGGTVSVANDKAFIYQGAIDEARYYYIAGGVSAVARDGGGAQSLGTLAVPARLALGTDEVYVSQNGLDEVNRYTKDGSGFSVLSHAVGPRELLFEGASLVWTRLPADGGLGGLTRYSFDRGGLELSDDFGWPTALAGDTNWLYFFDAGDKTIRRARRSALQIAPERIATVAIASATRASSVHADDAALYVALITGTEPQSTAETGVILKVPKCGGVPRVFAEGIFPSVVVGDDRYVYTGDKAGRLLRYRK